MKRKVVLAIAGFVLLGVGMAAAQIPTYPEEALLISRTTPGGTARIQGMGGVQNSLGGDVSSAYSNPAGLGMYNRSDLAISPAYLINNISSSYLGNSLSQNSTNFFIPNIGLALHSAKEGSSGFLGGTLGVSFNRTNDFNHTFTYQGTNNNNSIIDRFIQNATGSDISQFGSSGSNYNTPTGLGYFNYLIGPQSILAPNDPKNSNNPNPGKPTDYFTDIGGIPFQKETVTNSGAQNQWSISYGVNLNDKLFLGAGLGLTSFTYKSRTTYTEEFSGGPMSKMVLNESLDLSGSGINATFGAIFRPKDGFQVGLSVVTPTSYQITDNYSANMTSKWNGFQYDSTTFLDSNPEPKPASTDIVTSNYNISTPWRINGGLTYFIQKHGFISADIEWLNYGNTKYSSDTGDDWSADNNQIKGLYKSVVNVRVGGEYRIDKYRIRAGYNYMPDPYQTQQNGISNTITSYSTGAGYRTDKFYCDLALVFNQGDKTYRPYTVNSPTSPLVNLSGKATTIVFTIGFPF
jgi:hypothetical protein